MSMFKQLSAPFPGNAVSWRAQSLTGDGTKAMALCYIDARDVMNRLDDVCGPAGWQDSYHETAKGRLICTISINCDGVWVSKSDGAGDTDVEGEKGAISDAFKRTAVKWGIGRYLYDIEPVWAECESYEKNGKKHWKKWTQAGFARLAKVAPSVRVVEEKEPETPNHILDVLAEIETQNTQAALKAIWERESATVTNPEHQSMISEAINKRISQFKRKAA